MRNNVSLMFNSCGSNINLTQLLPRIRQYFNTTFAAKEVSKSKGFAYDACASVTKKNNSSLHGTSCVANTRTGLPRRRRRVPLPLHHRRQTVPKVVFGGPLQNVNGHTSTLEGLFRNANLKMN
jgi:hypothetical protein